MLVDIDFETESPLFSSYDLEIEFERLRAWIRTELECVRGRAQVVLHDRLQARLMFAQLEGITLMQGLSVLHQGQAMDTGPHGKRTFRYTYEIPFEGISLWNLYPRPLPDPPRGAVLGASLYLGCNAGDECEVFTVIRPIVAQIEAIILEQNRRIDDFNRELPSFIEAEMRRARITFAYE